MTTNAVTVYTAQTFKDSNELTAIENGIAVNVKKAVLSMADMIRQVRHVRDRNLWRERQFLTNEGWRPVYSGWLDWLETLAETIRDQGIKGFSTSTIRAKIRLADALEPLGYSLEDIITTPYQYLLEQAVDLYSGPQPRLKVSTGDEAEDVKQALALIEAVVTNSDHNPRSLIAKKMSSTGVTVTFYDYNEELWALVEDDIGYRKVRVASLEGDVGAALRHRVKPRVAEASVFFNDNNG